MIAIWWVAPSAASAGVLPQLEWALGHGCAVSRKVVAVALA